MKKNFEIPKKDPFTLDRSYLKKFKIKSRIKKSGYRVLCHYDPKKKLHQMLINHKKNEKIKIHKNTKSPKSYFLINGIMDLFYFKKKLKKKKIRISPNMRFVRLEKNWFHYLEIISKNVVFVETVLVT